MRKIVCEMCGSNNLIKENGYYVCEYCKTKYTVEEAQKLIIEGPIKIDRTDEINNLYHLARRAKAEKNVTKALEYYEKILPLDPSSVEAYLFSNYFAELSNTQESLVVRVTRFSKCINGTIRLLNEIESAEEKQAALDGIGNDIIDIAAAFFDLAQKRFDATGNYAEYYATANASIEIITAFADKINAMFVDNTPTALTHRCWNKAVGMYWSLSTTFYSDKDKRNEIQSLIRLYSTKLSLAGADSPTQGQGPIASSNEYESIRDYYVGLSKEEQEKRLKEYNFVLDKRLRMSKKLLRILYWVLIPFIFGFGYGIATVYVNEHPAVSTSPAVIAVIAIAIWLVLHSLIVVVASVCVKKNYEKQKQNAVNGCVEYNKNRKQKRY